MMPLRIDYHTSEPISHQVAGQIKLQVVNGTLAPGEQLPSIRQLARELKINPTTVTRIYGQLSAEGVITLRQGQGAFVSDGHPRLAPEEVLRLVREQAQELLVEGLRHGLSIDEIRAIVEEQYNRICAGASDE